MQILFRNSKNNSEDRRSNSPEICTKEKCALSRMVSYLIIDFQMLSSTHSNIREAGVVSLVSKVSSLVSMDCRS